MKKNHEQEVMNQLPGKNPTEYSHHHSRVVDFVVNSFDEILGEM